MPGPAFIEGDPVSLHVVEPADHDFVLRYRNHPETRRWQPRVRPHDRETVESHYGGPSTDWRGVSLLACVDDGSERVPVGLSSLFDLDEAAGRGELAGWVAPEHQGEGYGTHAARLLVEYAFAERRLNRLTAGVRADNERSRALLETLGFEQEGRMAEYFYVDCEHVDRVVYGLLANEWHSADGATSG